MDGETGEGGVTDRLLERLGSWLGAERVYGEPLERNGTVVVPVASVRAGGGGGSGSDPARGGGEGGGFGALARPAGMFVIRQDGQVRWQPAVDVNRILLVLNASAIVYLVLRWLGGPSGRRRR